MRASKPAAKAKGYTFLPIDENTKLDENVFIIAGANNLLISNDPPKLAMLDKKYDFRVSTMPTLEAESIFLRILDNKNT